MLAHGLLGDVEVDGDLTGSEFVTPHQFQYLSPVRIREGTQHRIGVCSALHITGSVRVCIAHLLSIPFP